MNKTFKRAVLGPLVEYWEEFPNDTLYQVSLFKSPSGRKEYVVYGIYNNKSRAKYIWSELLKRLEYLAPPSLKIVDYTLELQEIKFIENSTFSPQNRSSYLDDLLRDSPKKTLNSCAFRTNDNKTTISTLQNPDEKTLQPVNPILSKIIYYSKYNKSSPHNTFYSIAFDFLTVSMRAKAYGFYNTESSAIYNYQKLLDNRINTNRNIRKVLIQKKSSQGWHKYRIKLDIIMFYSNIDEVDSEFQLLSATAIRYRGRWNKSHTISTSHTFSVYISWSGNKIDY